MNKPDSEQLNLIHPPHRNQSLFADHYLNHILPSRARWSAMMEYARAAMERIAVILNRFAPSENERQTEDNLVVPILKVLGHTFEVQAPLRTPEGAKTPDYVFYHNTDAIIAHKNKILTDALPDEGGIAVGDAKYWNRPLDNAIKRKSADPLSNKNPSYQIYYYMLHSGVKWGILTNGKQWRLYHADTAHKLDVFYEVDLEELITEGDVSRFLYFYAFFRREAFDDGPFSIAAILRESTDYARDVGNSLKDQVYEALRHIAQGFLDYPNNGLKSTLEDLKTIYDNSLIVLYRLIFILYAEARELLPLRESRQYRDTYSLYAIKRSVARDIDSGRTLLPTSALLWPRLMELFNTINLGNPPLKVSTFNGGLFDPERHDFLTKRSVGDAHLQQAIDKLARINREFVDYRDLAVRHMGTIYEGLLEYRLQPIDATKDGWQVELINNKGERKTSGSYYTPDEIVKYIVEHTIGPLLERAVADKNTDADKLRAVLEVNVLDPAMGSGHFLVEATEYIARFLVDMAITPEGKTPEEADVAFWKRRVVQSCIYGVDLNPLAVELAKLSLWLTTVAKDRPLSFLDHHLRPGNSLVGAKLEHLEMRKAVSKKHKEKENRDGGQIALLTDSDFTQRMSHALTLMQMIEDSESSSVEQVKQQEKWYEEFGVHLIGKYARLLNTITAAQLGMEIDKDCRALLPAYVGNRNGFPLQTLEKLLDQADEIGKQEHFFHWELEFPEIFFDRYGRPLDDEAGFDAVVGNPPWERIKLQENEFFAGRDSAVALAPTAAQRRRLIDALAKKKTALWQDYEAARTKAENFLSYARHSGYYPLMGRGDTNYYALFAEKALQMVSRNGRVGILTPSGIATDDTTKSYFQHLIDRRMLAELLDFENREGMFPDVHRSFKFSIVLATGEDLPQNTIRCGFFLHNVLEIEDPDRICFLMPDDFRLFNPNTLTCPVFRRRRDAELTRKVYRNVPALVDRQKGESGNPWGISFLRMFDMTNDSGLFKTAAQLEQEGYWRGAGNVYTKGKNIYLPLYEGKMAQMYDHRAAGIVVNPANLHRPAHEKPTTERQHSDPAFSPMPQFWVDKQEVEKRLSGNLPKWLLGFKSITAPTNIRSFICAPIPVAGVGNSMPVLQFGNASSNIACCLVANLSAFALDFAARQKIGGQNLNFFVVEQFPVLPPKTYKRKWHGVLLNDFIKQRVLELCYTAHDLKGFADDMGYDGPPFAWDEERRLHLRCQLDALYFHLYKLTRDEAAEIMETFPIVKRQDGAAYGTFRTKDLILAYYNAYTAGNMDAWVKG